MTRKVIIRIIMTISIIVSHRSKALVLLGGSGPIHCFFRNIMILSTIGSFGIGVACVMGASSPPEADVVGFACYFVRDLCLAHDEG